MSVCHTASPAPSAPIGAPLLVEHVRHDVDLGIARRATAAVLLAGRRIELAEAAREGQQVVVGQLLVAKQQPECRFQACSIAKSASLRRDNRHRRSPRPTGRAHRAHRHGPCRFLLILAAMIGLRPCPIKRPSSGAEQRHQPFDQLGRDRGRRAGRSKPVVARPGTGSLRLWLTPGTITASPGAPRLPHRVDQRLDVLHRHHLAIGGALQHQAGPVEAEQRLRRVERQQALAGTGPA